jgi:N-acetylneuraminate lyase
MVWLTGIMPALLTPFDAEDNVNTAMARELVEFQLTQDITGFYVCGGTGEGILQTEAERRLMAETVVDQVKGRVPVIVHIGAITTAAAARLAAHAKEAGADGISSVPPFYFNVGFQGIKEHYAEIAAASDLPIYIYNVPGATGVNVTPAMFKEMCEEIPTIAGMKFTSYNFFEMRQIIDLEIRGKKLNIVSGPDELMVAAQAMGAHGAIGTFYNVIPKLFADAYSAFRAGDVKKATELQALANKVIGAYFTIGGGISAVKAMMKMIGFDCGSGRRPNPPLSAEKTEKLKTALTEIGFFDFVPTR